MCHDSQREKERERERDRQTETEREKGTHIFCLYGYDHLMKEILLFLPYPSFQNR